MKRDDEDERIEFNAAFEYLVVLEIINEEIMKFMRQELQIKVNTDQNI